MHDKPPERPHRLAIVSTHVVQYQAPLFRLLAEHPAIDLTVLYCSTRGLEGFADPGMGVEVRWDVDLTGGYDSVFLRDSSIPGGFLRSINFDLPTKLNDGRYDAVIFMQGWGSLSAWMGVLACIANRIPFFFYGDSNEIPTEDSLRGRIRAKILRALFRRTAGFLVSGIFNGDYYAHYGGDRSRFFHVPWAVDNERFANESSMTFEERSQMRAEFGIPSDSVVILFPAKLVPRKDPFLLLEAFSKMPSQHLATLLFAGDGSERPAMEQHCRSAGLENVVFLGFINQTMLPRVYGMSDIFALPSRFEPRGAVVNEAMACGLPCVVSDRVGSSGDIVVDGDNGFVFPFGDATTLTDSLERIVHDPERRRKMGLRSREIISTWDYNSCVSGIVEASRSVRRFAAAEGRLTAR